MTRQIALEHGACEVCTTDRQQVWHRDPVDGCTNRQPRERRVQCQRCRVYLTLNVSAVCERCKHAAATSLQPGVRGEPARESAPRAGVSFGVAVLTSLVPAATTVTRL